jgi:hypothetical protein
MPTLKLARFARSENGSRKTELARQARIVQGEIYCFDDRRD